MSKGDFGTVVVVENGGNVRGILTDRDIVVRAVAEGKDPAPTEIREVFTTEPTTLAQARDERSALADISAAEPNN